MKIIALFEVLLAFALADAAVVAWTANLITGTQVAAYTAAYLLVAIGSLITAHRMARR